MLHLRMDDEPYIAQWVADHFKHVDRFGTGRAVGFYDDDHGLVGGIVLCPRGGYFDAELSIAFEPGWAKRITRAHLRTLFSLCYDQWGLTRLTVHIAKRNKPARRFVQRLGWVQEGVLHKGYDGQQTAIVYGMLRENCKVLSKLKEDSLGFDPKPPGPATNRNSAGQG